MLSDNFNSTSISYSTLELSRVPHECLVKTTTFVVLHKLGAVNYGSWTIFKLLLAIKFSFNDNPVIYFVTVILENVNGKTTV